MVLSDQDIKQELGINIIIYPFKEENLKGASYNLTASKYAWSLETKETIAEPVIGDDGKIKRDNENNEIYKIVILPGDTALIETQEVIWISEKISGTYHSRVGDVSHGTGHIGTTLDPNYVGLSLIAVHNHSSKPRELSPGKDKFVSLVFHYNHTESANTQHGNTHGRKDILGELGINRSPEENHYLDQAHMSDTKQLLKKLEECSDYSDIKEKRKEAEKNKEQKIFSKKLYFWVGIPFLLFLLLNLVLIFNESEWRKTKWYKSAEVFTETLRDISGSALVLIFIAINQEQKLKK